MAWSVHPALLVTCHTGEPLPDSPPLPPVPAAVPLWVCVVTQVTRNGVQNACSIAGIMLTTQAVMVERNKPTEIPGGMSPAGMPSGMTI